MSKESQEKPEIKKLTKEELDALYGRIDDSLTKEDADLIKKIIKFTFWIQGKFQETGITLSKLKNLIFGTKSEKRDKDDDDEGSAEISTEGSERNSTPTKSKGHGKNGHEVYKNARQENIKHEFYKAGNECPLGCGGKLYNIEPGMVMRIYGQSEAEVVKYEVEKLRCSSCLEIFTANTEHIGNEKYDDHFKAIIATRKYFAGMPLYRQEQYFAMQGVPLSDSKQWELIEEVADCAYPIFLSLERVAANGKVVYQDDTKYKILRLIKQNINDRSGVYTTNLTVEVEEHIIALYCTQNKHAGENLEKLLKQRTLKEAIIQMSDALNSNHVKADTIECNCLAHARRKFIEIEEYWPEETAHAIKLLQIIYKNESIVKKEKMSDDERLLYHQKHSASVMKEYKKYLEDLIYKSRVEPNGALGQAVKYSLNHWEKLTKFLSVQGAAIDNNEAERKLKIPIRTRKNSLFYLNLHGVFIGSMLMSIIATCLTAGVNAIKYLTELQKNREKVRIKPELWLPWNYELMDI